MQHSPHSLSSKSVYIECVPRMPCDDNSVTCKWDMTCECEDGTFMLPTCNRAKQSAENALSGYGDGNNSESGYGVDVQECDPGSFKLGGVCVQCPAGSYSDGTKQVRTVCSWIISTCSGKFSMRALWTWVVFCVTRCNLMQWLQSRMAKQGIQLEYLVRGCLHTMQTWIF